MELTNSCLKHESPTDGVTRHGFDEKKADKSFVLLEEEAMGIALPGNYILASAQSRSRIKEDTDGMFEVRPFFVDSHAFEKSYTGEAGKSLVCASQADIWVLKAFHAFSSPFESPAPLLLDETELEEIGNLHVLNRRWRWHRLAATGRSNEEDEPFLTLEEEVPMLLGQPVFDSQGRVVGVVCGPKKISIAAAVLPVWVINLLRKAQGQ